MRIVHPTAEKMRSSGISIKKWAKYHGFNVQYVYHVIAGRVKHYIGESGLIVAALKKDKFWVEPEKQVEEGGISPPLKSDGAITGMTAHTG